MVATGRAPNVERLGLAEAGIALDQRGAIVVDDYMRTSKAGIYAAGDVADRDQFVYMAAHGAKLAARNALNGDRLRYDNSAMPWVVFTDPQGAGVGLTESKARADGRDVKTSVVALGQVPRASPREMHAGLSSSSPMRAPTGCSAARSLRQGAQTASRRLRLRSRKA